MAKQKTAFVCNDCGSDYSKWQGQCNDCGAWNTLAEIKLGPAKGSGRAGAGAVPRPTRPALPEPWMPRGSSRTST